VVSPGLKRRKKKYKMIAGDVDLYLVYGWLSVVFSKALACPFIGREEARTTGALR
jgi:hypothetical protein